MNTDVRPCQMRTWRVCAALLIGMTVYNVGAFRSPALPSLKDRTSFAARSPRPAPGSPVFTLPIPRTVTYFRSPCTLHAECAAAGSDRERAAFTRLPQLVLERPPARSRRTRQMREVAKNTRRR